jgi:hypothetical protein
LSHNCFIDKKVIFPFHDHARCSSTFSSRIGPCSDCMGHERGLWGSQCPTVALS